MAIKFGPRGAVRAPKAGQQGPANLGRANDWHPAQAELDYTVARASAQYAEAIAMDGVPIHYWRRHAEGRFCSCQTQIGGGAGPNGGSVFRADAEPGTNEAAPTSFRVRGGAELFESRDNPVTIAGAGSLFGGFRIGDLPEIEQGNAVLSDGTPDQTLEDWITRPDDEHDAPLDAFLQNTEADAVYGAERTPCAICLKTGYVGGYHLLHGQRLVLDTTDPSVRLYGFETDRVSRPFDFTSAMDPRTAVEWDLELPTYFDAFIGCTVRHNLRPVSTTLVEYRPQGSTGPWTIFDADSVAALRGTRALITLRARPRERSAHGECRFSHIELLFQTTVWPKVQMGALDHTTDYGVGRGTARRNTSFTIPPSIPGVRNGDVIWDQKYGILWKITGVTDFMTAARQVCGWTAQAREIQDDEMLYLLKAGAVPYVELNYGGLEAVQGAGLVREDRLLGPL